MYHQQSMALFRANITVAKLFALVTALALKRVRGLSKLALPIAITTSTLPEQEVVLVVLVFPQLGGEGGGGQPLCKNVWYCRLLVLSAGFGTTFW
jgi:hypothetical protein